MRTLLGLSAILLAVALVTGCGSDTDPGGDAGATTQMDAGGNPQSFSLAAEGFGRGENIPIALTCDGADRSPRLFWTAVPDGARELALIVDDPDAGGFVHWVAYNTPSTAREYTTNQVEGPLATFGANDFGRTGWAGPCPPQGDPHQYDFTMYALSEPVQLEPGATAAELRSAMDGKIVGEACISAFYQRRES